MTTPTTYDLVNMMHEVADNDNNRSDSVSMAYGRFLSERDPNSPRSKSSGSRYGSYPTRPSSSKNGDKSRARNDIYRREVKEQIELKEKKKGDKVKEQERPGITDRAAQLLAASGGRKRAIADNDESPLLEKSKRFKPDNVKSTISQSGGKEGKKSARKPTSEKS